MKKIYIIQEAANPTKIIAFRSERNLRSYLYKFDFKRKQEVECETNNVCVFGVISDCKDENGNVDRAIYARVIETSSYSF